VNNFNLLYLFDSTNIKLVLFPSTPNYIRCMKRLFFYLIIFSPLIGFSQKNKRDSLITNYLQRIENLQLNTGKSFPTGIIPSYRQYSLNKIETKPDDNIFFSGLVMYTLKECLPKLNSQQQIIVDSIRNRIKRSAYLYKNVKGRNTYNFWRTNPSKVFPNSGWINLFDKVNALPDDMDDTVMMLLALEADSTEASALHNLMQTFRNGSKKQIKNTLPEYKNSAAYSTWFGVKFPVDFDLCVLSNVLLFVQKNNLQWSHADSASLQLITQVITQKQHVSIPHSISPHYAQTSIILYHISRLMQVKPIASLEVLKPQLIMETKEALAKTNNVIEQVLLTTALQRWNVKPTNTIIIEDNAAIEHNNFSFFIANMASMAPNPFKDWIGKIGVGKFYYYCAAYNYALMIENLLLSKN